MRTPFDRTTPLPDPDELARFNAGTKRARDAYDPNGTTFRTPDAEREKARIRTALRRAKQKEARP